MAWIIKNVSGMIIDIRDLHVTFQQDQVRDVDILGRENSERSSDLAQMLQKGYLFQIAKDAAMRVDGQLVQKLERAAEKMESVSVQSSKNAAEIEGLKKSNSDLQKSNEQLSAKIDGAARTFEEVKSFFEKFPVQAKAIAESMRNIQAEQKGVAEQRERLQESGTSDAEIRVQDRILASKGAKLQKNLENLGNVVAHKEGDLDKQLEAMEKAGI